MTSRKIESKLNFDHMTASHIFETSNYIIKIIYLRQSVSSTIEIISYNKTYSENVYEFVHRIFPIHHFKVTSHHVAPTGGTLR